MDWNLEYRGTAKTSMKDRCKPSPDRKRRCGVSKHARMRQRSLGDVPEETNYHEQKFQTIMSTITETSKKNSDENKNCRKDCRFTEELLQLDVRSVNIIPKEGMQEYLNENISGETKQYANNSFKNMIIYLSNEHETLLQVLLLSPLLLMAAYILIVEQGDLYWYI